MGRPDRRFTIFDFLVLTVVMAGASLAARSEAFVTAEQFRQVAAAIKAGPGAMAPGSSVLTVGMVRMPFPPRGKFAPGPATPGAGWDDLWGVPDTPSQLRSVRLILTADVANLLRAAPRIMWVRPGVRGHALFLLRQCVVLLSPILVGLGFALLLLRVVRPRPAWPDLARQPGPVACAAAIVALFGAFWVEELWRIPVSVAAVGAAVGLSWLGLALSRRWRPEASWLDRAGRALGACWLLAGALAAV